MMTHVFREGLGVTSRSPPPKPKGNANSNSSRSPATATKSGSGTTVRSPSFSSNPNQTFEDVVRQAHVDPAFEANTCGWMYKPNFKRGAQFHTPGKRDSVGAVLSQAWLGISESVSSGRYKRRYFVLDRERSGCLRYFKSEQSTKEQVRRGGGERGEKRERERDRETKRQRDREERDREFVWLWRGGWVGDRDREWRQIGTMNLFYSTSMCYITCCGSGIMHSCFTHIGHSPPPSSSSLLFSKGRIDIAELICVRRSQVMIRRERRKGKRGKRGTMAYLLHPM